MTVKNVFAITIFMFFGTSCGVTKSLSSSERSMLFSESCFEWPANGGSIQEAISNNSCVVIAAGVWETTARIFVPGGHILRGVGQDKTIIRAVNPWVGNGPNDPGEGLIEGSAGVGRRTVSNLTLDANKLAALGVSSGDITLSHITVRNATCDGISISSYGVVIQDSLGGWDTFTVVTSAPF